MKGGYISHTPVNTTIQLDSDILAQRSGWMALSKRSEGLTGGLMQIHVYSMGCKYYCKLLIPNWKGNTGRVSDWESMGEFYQIEKQFEGEGRKMAGKKWGDTGRDHPMHWKGLVARRRRDRYGSRLWRGFDEGKPA